jgi:hypothetical protein
VARNIQCTTSTASRRPGRPRHDEPASPAVSEGVQTVSDRWIPREQSLGDSITNTVEQSINQLGYGDDAFVIPQPGFQQDFTLQPDPLPEFEDFATAAQGLDFMNGLWALAPLTLDSSIDDNSFSLFDDSWLQFSGSMPDQPTERALDMMRLHFRLRSRAPSPSRVEMGQQQYSIAPDLARYDPDIINVFLNLARSHLGDAFPLFSSFQATSDTEAELCLATAAIGALYCSISGSIKIARSLYNDARRLLLESYFAHQDSSKSLSRSHTMTFILLELYGICSGNKRSYEFSEVWHGLLLDAAAEHLSAPGLDYDQTSDLQSSIRMLESYRVLILGLPPSMAKATDPCNVATLSEAMSPCSINVSHESPDISDLIRIAGVVGSCNTDSRIRLWKAEFVELALDRWLRLQQLPAVISQQLLFHMTHIYLHANIPLLQRYAMARASSHNTINLPNELHSWISSQDYRVSRWHAEKIVACIKRQANSKASVLRSQSAFKSSEPPHLSYCLYFAIVVVWYGNLRSDKTSLDEKAVVEGIELLSGLKVHVAKLLAIALREMLLDNSRAEE